MYLSSRSTGRDSAFGISFSKVLRSFSNYCFVDEFFLERCVADYFIRAKFYFIRAKFYFFLIANLVTMPGRSILPFLLGRDWWDMWDYPTRIMDQCFADHLRDDDLLPASLVGGFMVRPRTQANISASGQSQITNDDKQFEVTLNVSQFKPEELQVKVVDNYVVIHGKHEEKSDEHGFVSREFTRRYMLPASCEMETVASSLSPDGVLTITAPKKAIEAPPKQEREIPISKECDKAVEGESSS